MYENPNFGWTAIQTVAEKGEAEIRKLINSLIESAKLNPKNDTLIFVAINEGHLEIVEILAHHEMTKKFTENPNAQTSIQAAVEKEFQKVFLQIAKALQPLSKNTDASDPANPPSAKRPRRMREE